MEWRGPDEVRWLEAGLPGGKAAFTTRLGGSAATSRQPLASALGIGCDRIATARQVHGTDLLFHEGGGEKATVPVGDGHVLAEPGLAALVFVADCLPVALAGPGGLAILHCGWRGLAAGIVERGAAAVAATHAAIGPGIGPCCFEVGEEVLAAFEPLATGLAGGRLLDLPAVTRRLLRNAGVERVETAELCTRCEADLFFSYRREGDAAGRQAGLVWLEGTAA
jgi:polyphenol oxidase